VNKPEIDVRAWHRIIIAFFAVFALASISLMVRLPEIRELLAVNTAELGLILVAGSIGSLASLSMVGQAIGRFGTKPIILIFSTLFFIAFLGQALFATVSSVPGYVVAAIVAGFAAGAADVGINVDGSVIEKTIKRSALPRMHAAFSFGALGGATIGTFATSINFPLLWQVGILVVVSFALPIYALRILPANNGRESADDLAAAKEPTLNTAGIAIKPPRILSLTVLGLGLGILGMTLGEGASNDWLTLAVVDDYKENATVAGAAYSVLLGSMAITRFFGGNLADRFGRALTLRATGLAGIIGLVTIIIGVNISIVFAFVGAALWGVGVALAFPLFLSAAGEQDNPAKKVALVTTFGYAAFLVGPPLLGLLGQAWGLTNMYWVITLFLVMSFIVAGSAGKTRSATHTKLGESPLEVDVL
jgi:MFS family permease